MTPYLEVLANKAPFRVSAYPNAGLPNEMGEYDLDADTMAREIGEWADSGFLNIIGGCCGTTPEHIAAIAEAVTSEQPRLIPERSRHPSLPGLEPPELTE